ncbi:hypothetical protein EV193_106132 [Herbihabitans rhizosphaerae]|uniref:SH3 domain-containing protein n=1 Tax=Herbihabitans rhizosphaerae TaxID=1872711 RepID=A0A4Q7KJY3_9PSEU|nr:SH3 domain-containing protein [Herbihabitans rhizosphaerae]RZS36898.1 hypothetical protein EV193_106132 [Herbihabitans rhizosphaerae]
MPGKRVLIIIAVAAGVLVLYLLGSEKQREKAAASPGGQTSSSSSSSSTQCRMVVTADILNVRSSPEQNAPKVGSYKKDAQTDAEKTVQNGFRKLSDNRWASADFLKALPGRDC